MTDNEKRHVALVKTFNCGNCNAPGPSDAHHIIENGTRVSHYCVIPLCHACHRGANTGIHGNRLAWRITKKTELMILGEVIKQLWLHHQHKIL